MSPECASEDHHYPHRKDDPAATDKCPECGKHGHLQGKTLDGNLAERPQLYRCQNGHEWKASPQPDKNTNTTCKGCANAADPNGKWDRCVACVTKLEVDVARLKAELEDAYNDCKDIHEFYKPWGGAIIRRQREIERLKGQLNALKTAIMGNVQPATAGLRSMVERMNASTTAPTSPASPPIKADEGHFVDKPTGSGKAADPNADACPICNGCGYIEPGATCQTCEGTGKTVDPVCARCLSPRSAHGQEGIPQACGAFMQGDETKSAPEKPAGVPFAERLKIRRMTRKLPP